MRKRKNVILAAGIGVLLAIGTAGCGDEAAAVEAPVRIQNTSIENVEDAGFEDDGEEKESAEKGDKEEASGSREEETEDKKEMAKDQTDTEAEELTGSVERVAADHFVISEIVTEHHDDYDLAVSAAPESGQEELITVYVKESASYTFKTVKNSGMNPEDITERQGSYDDLQEGIIVTMNGYWEDGAFYADNLEMAEYVH